MNADVEAIVAGYAPTKYGSLAAFSMLVYDYALTFDAEVEFVWQRRWSFGKALFIFNRYFGLLSLLSYVIAFFYSGALSIQFCQRFTWWNVTSDVVAIVGAEIALIIRAYVVYDCNRRLLLVIIALAIAAGVSSSLLVILGMSKITLTTVSETTGCQGHAPPPLEFISLIPPLLFETFLMSLMLYKGWILYRSNTGFQLLQIIIRDSLLYFGLMLMVLLANCVLWAVSSRSQLDVKIGISWAIAIPCAIGSRLLLNMRERYYKTTILRTDMSEE